MFRSSPPNKVDGKINILNSKVDKEGKASLSFEFIPSDINFKAVKIKSSLKNGHLNSVCLIQSENEKWTTFSEFKIEITKPNYRNNMNVFVEEVAMSIKNRFGKEQIKSIESTLNAIPELLFEKLGEEYYFKETSLSLFYHLGASKSARRSLFEQIEDCKCGEYQSYINEESPFFCSEDKVVSNDEVYELLLSISEERRFANKKFVPSITLSYLADNQGSFVSASKIDELYRSEFDDFFSKSLTKSEQLNVINGHYTLNNLNTRLKSSNVEDEVVLPTSYSCYLYGVTSGSDCGCCGNYSGNCMFCNLACYIHDTRCVTCTPRWFCFSGCVPGGC